MFLFLSTTYLWDLYRTYYGISIKISYRLHYSFS